MVRRSKPRIHVDILEVLAFHGPLKPTHITYKAKVNSNVLKQRLDFLIKQNLVKERTLGNEKAIYAITKRGMRVLKGFWEQKQVMPIMDARPRESRGISTLY